MVFISASQEDVPLNCCFSLLTEAEEAMPQWFSDVGAQAAERRAAVTILSPTMCCYRILSMNVNERSSGLSCWTLFAF